MINLKSGIKLVLLLSFFYVVSNLKAQQNEMMGNRKELAEKRFKELSERLQLTTEQQTKLKAIAKGNRVEMKQLRDAKKDAPKEERKVAMVNQLKKVNDQINVILTPKQQELFKQYKSEKKTVREKKMKEKLHEREEREDGRLF